MGSVVNTACVCVCVCACVRVCVRVCVSARAHACAVTRGADLNRDKKKLKYWFALDTIFKLFF